MLALEGQLLDELAGDGDVLRGELALGASTGPGGTVVPVLLGEFQRANPELSVALSISDTNRVIVQVAERELELAFGHLLDHPIRVRNRERDTQLRVRALELAEQHRDDRATRPGRGAERKLATQHVAVSCELVEQLPLEREHALRGPVEALPRLSRLDPSPRAVEQLRPKPLLERANLKADGRLGHPEPLGGLREALAVDDFAE